MTNMVMLPSSVLGRIVEVLSNQPYKEVAVLLSEIQAGAKSVQSSPIPTVGEVEMKQRGRGE